MARYQITANAITSDYEAASEQDAIKAYLADAGYSTVEIAAEACGQSVEEFLNDINVVELGWRCLSG